MAQIRDLYPFSTRDGKVIPLDILRPKSVARISFLEATPSAALDLVEDTPILILRTTAPCVIRFGSVPVVLSQALVAGQMFLDAGEIYIIAPPSNLLYVMGDGVAGNLTVQVIERWVGLAADINFRRP